MDGKKYGSYEEKAKRIIEENRYMALSTCDKKNMPWANAVFYAFSSDYDFYFLSAVDSRHAENIEQNEGVAFTIFDSRQPVGCSDGIQAEGKADKLKGQELSKAIKLYAERVFDGGAGVPPLERYKPEDYSGAAEFRFFRIRVSSLYVTGVDRRVEVILKKMPS